MKPEKKKKLDEFLAAPDTLRKSETELRKARERKARLEAEEARLRATKEKAKPTTEDILGDMIRVAEDRDVNPYWKFRTLSRQRYRLYGHFPIESVDEMFGEFEHAKEVAGLRDQPGTRAKKAAIAARSRREHAGRYVERFILPHVNKHPEIGRKLTKTEVVLVISDAHGVYLDPFTWHAFLCACRDLKPDLVIFNGDPIDCPEISRHPKVPGWTVPLQLELDFNREMFRQLRLVLRPDARIVLTNDNHFVDRMASYLTQVAPGLSSLRCLRVDELLGLEEHDVALAMGGTFVSPAGTEGNSTGLTLHGFYRVHHGVKLGKDAAMMELLEAGMSGTSGHIHRAMLYYGASETHRGLSWMSTPMACNDVAGRAYRKGTCTGWQKGFGVAFLLPDGRVHQYPVVTDGDVAVVEGYLYRRPKNVADPDITKLWLSDVEVPK